MKKVLLVGSGKMGSALLTNWAKKISHLYELTVIEPNNDASTKIRSLVANAYKKLSEIPKDYDPDIVLFAVKPQIMEAVVPEFKIFTRKALFISIAAGKKISFFENHLGKEAAIIRVMPNIASSVERGVSVAMASLETKDIHKQLCSDLLEAVGEVYWLEEEKQIDSATAISGSGPAYFFLLTECLSSVGEKIGLPSELANKLSRATAIGSGELLYQSDLSTENLRTSVTSKGGTTEAALKVLLNENQLETLVEKAVQKAYQRSKELSS